MSPLARLRVLRPSLLPADMSELRVGAEHFGVYIGISSISDAYALRCDASFLNIDSFFRTIPKLALVKRSFLRPGRGYRRLKGPGG